MQYSPPRTWPTGRWSLLTPGVYNSAYFEHSFLAQQMGIELVRARTWSSNDGYVHMRTTKGLRRVDVIYRRIDDDFLDPHDLPPRLAAGRAGLDGRLSGRPRGAGQRPGNRHRRRQGDLRLRAGNHQVLPERRRSAVNVPTFICSDEKQRQHVLANLDNLSSKPTNESGGYGMLIGPQASKSERDKFHDLISSTIRATTSPSRCSRFAACRRSSTTTLEGRHVDLRPYILYGKDIYVLPGGLTRVALEKGSMVVNSLARGRQQRHLGDEHRRDEIPAAVRRTMSIGRGSRRREASTC